MLRVSRIIERPWFRKSAGQGWRLLVDESACIDPRECLRRAHSRPHHLASHTQFYGAGSVLCEQRLNVHVHSSSCAFTAIPWPLSVRCAMEAVFLPDFVASVGVREGEEDAAGLDALGL